MCTTNPGACLALLLAAAFEQPSNLPQLKIPTDHPPLKFCIAISGFRSRDPALQQLFQTQLKTPTLSILGKADQIVDAQRSQTLIDICMNHRTEWHNGGHVVPSQAPWRNFIRDWIATFQTQSSRDNVIGPSARVGQGGEDDGDSAPSGTATPRKSTL